MRKSVQSLLPCRHRFIQLFLIQLLHYAVVA
jgi:hypothetical protein